MAQNNKAAKIIAVVLSMLLFFNLTLFILNKISGAIFWLTVIVIALISFKGMPHLKEK